MRKQRVLITGSEGFVGGHLTDFLSAKKNVEIFGIDIPSVKSKPANKSVKLFGCDLKNKLTVSKIIKEIKPAKIFHLAGRAFVGDSWSNPQKTFTVNLFGELNILNSLVELKLNPRVQIACSSEEYGLVAEKDLPVSEENELRPLSPYAVSKIAQDYLGYQYYKSYGLNIVRTRSFNHIGPRQSESFVVSNFARQIALIEAGRQEPVINVGNLNAVRDFTDVRDIVKAYWLCTEKGLPGEVYNICSGKGQKIADILKTLLSLSGVKVQITKDPKRMRPSDVPVLIGNNKKFVKKTGWKLEYSLAGTLSAVLNYWREEIQC